MVDIIVPFDELAPTTALGDMICHDGSGNARLPGSTVAAKRFLTQTGNGTTSAVPAWAEIDDEDIPPTLSANARVAVSKDDSLIGTRRQINFIEGSNVSLTITDDPENEIVDVMISASGGSGPWTAASGFIRPTTPSNITRLGVWTGNAHGIFTPVGTQQLQVIGESSTGGGMVVQCWCAQDSLTSGIAEFTGYSIGGTVASPTKTQTGRIMTRFGTVGYTGTTLTFSGCLDFVATADFDVTHRCDAVIKLGGPAPSEHFRVSDQFNRVTVPHLHAFGTFKADGTTFCEVAIVDSSNIQYLGGSTAAKTVIYNADVQLGIDSNSIVTSKGLLVASNDVRVPNGGAFKGFKLNGSTLVEMVSIEANNVVYLGGSPADSCHLYNNTWTIGLAAGSLQPNTDNQFALGAPSKRFTTLYSTALNTGDLHMDDDEKNSHWTLREAKLEDEDRDALYAINRRTNMRFKVRLEAA